MAKKRKIETGKVEIPANEFEPKRTKVRISIFVDGDLLDALKAKAAQTNGKYQTLMNQILRDHLLGNAEEERIRAIVIEELEKRAG